MFSGCLFNSIFRVKIVAYLAEPWWFSGLALTWFPVRLSSAHWFGQQSDRHAEICTNRENSW